MQIDKFTQICDVNFASQNIESWVKQLLNSEMGYHLFDMYSSVGTETGYGLEDEETVFDYQKGQEIFVFCTASRPNLRLTQPPIQWVPDAFLWGLSGRNARLTTHLRQIPKLGKCASTAPYGESG
jgi:hypothetical protein